VTGPFIDEESIEEHILGSTPDYTGKKQSLLRLIPGSTLSTNL